MPAVTSAGWSRMARGAFSLRPINRLARNLEPGGQSDGFNVGLGVAIREVLRTLPQGPKPRLGWGLAVRLLNTSRHAVTSDELDELVTRLVALEVFLGSAEPPSDAVGSRGSARWPASGWVASLVLAAVAIGWLAAMLIHLVMRP